MNAATVQRDRHLRALGVEPLRLRARTAEVAGVAIEARQPAAPAAQAAAVATRITRLALQPDAAGLEDLAIRKMYEALTVAVGKAGLQRVRPCDVADDPAAMVMVFGTASLPEGVPAVRVWRADPLAVLHADRERKRLLWERMQALGRDGRV